jgi:serine phosphatase RsbU (regulator of sigma subunit)
MLSKLADDPMPIGIFMTPLKPFADNVMEIRNGDRLYLFSDGYTDQFGGEKRKRWMMYS